ncbi:hypothetical protein ACF0H5_012993 [Mactra antiquata]
MAQKRSNRVYICIGLTVVIILSLLIAVIVLATKKDDDTDSTSKNPSPEVQGSSDLMEFFNVKDGIQVTWHPAAVNELDVKEAIKAQAHAVEIFLVTTSGKFIMKNGSTTVEEIFRLVKHSGTILKINLETSRDVTSDVINLLKKIDTTNLESPVIITISVFSSIFNWDKFLSNDVRQWRNVVFNFDLTTQCCQSPIGRGVIEKVGQLQKRLKTPSTVEINVKSVQSSWDDIRWLLDVNDRLTLILSTTTLVGTDYIYSALIVRNDMDKNRIFYNFGGTIFSEFKAAASTAGSALLYFDINPRDAGNIIWSHNTDTWEQINAATAGDVQMIEGDIQVLGQGTTNQTNIPIMAHDIGDNNNITFEQWLDEIIKVDKGMKFDFKSIDAVRPALKITSSKLDQIKGPIWLNADIVKGPNGIEPRIPKQAFLNAALEFGPSTLSLGWTTVRKGDNYHLKYTMEMVKEMYEITKNLKQPITFPVRAEQLKDSMLEFDWLLNQSRGYTLTVWTSHGDNVTKSDMDYVKRQHEAARIYFDLPVELRPTI